MVTNVAARRIPPALALLLWCALATALVQVVLGRLGAGNPHGFTLIFWQLLSAFDTHGNLLLAALAVAAFLLRRHAGALALVRYCGDHPWHVAVAVLPLLCLGSLTAYRAYPLALDEYTALFQAQAFAGGRLGGQFPPELLDSLLPRVPAGYFFIASRATGEVSGSYWPGFSLLVAPFAWLGIPWAANPVISALTLPALHRLALAISGSREAAGWAVLFLLASPVFVVSALSYYSMPAHLLCNLLYASLLLRPTAGRALLAGLVGGLALTLHNPAPHLLFCVAFIGWLFVRRASFAVFVALAAGYLPAVAILGYAWSQHLAALGASIAPSPAAGQQPEAVIPTLMDRIRAMATGTLSWPTARILEARLAGLSKAWTWGATGLLVLAAWGMAVARELPGVKVLGAALAITFFGYFLVPLEQGHGWGYRYLHSAWFVLPLLAGLCLVRVQDKEMQYMAAWAVALSLVLANGLRLVQVDGFIARHLGQVPPLARAADPARAEIVFIDPRGFYTRDMVHNDPFLRDARITMVYDGSDKAAALMAQRFPAYTKRAEGKWGELWTK